MVADMYTRNGCYRTVRTYADALKSLTILLGNYDGPSQQQYVVLHMQESELKQTELFD